MVRRAATQRGVCAEGRKATASRTGRGCGLSDGFGGLFRAEPRAGAFDDLYHRRGFARGFVLGVLAGASAADDDGFGCILPATARPWLLALARRLAAPLLDIGLHAVGLDPQPTPLALDGLDGHARLGGEAAVRFLAKPIAEGFECGYAGVVDGGATDTHRAPGQPAA